MSYEQLPWFELTFTAASGALALLLLRRRRATQSNAAAQSLVEHDQTFARLERRVVELDAHVATVDNERRELLRCQTELETQLESRTADLTNAQNIVRAKNEEVLRALRRQQQLEALSADQTRRLELCAETIRALESQSSPVVEHSADQATERTTWEQRVAELEARLVRKDQELAQHADALNALREVQRNSTDLAAENSQEISSRVHTLEEVLASRESELAHAIEERVALRQQLAGRAAEAHETETRCATLSKDLADARQSAETRERLIAERLAQVSADLAEATAAAEQSTMRAAQLEQQVAARERELTDLRGAADQNTSTLKTECDRLRDRLRDDLRTRDDRIAALELLRIDAETQANIASEALAEMEATRESRVADFQLRLAERDEALHTRTRELDAVWSELDARTRSSEDLERRCEELSATVAQQSARIKELEERENSIVRANERRVGELDAELRHRQDELNQHVETSHALRNERELYQRRTEELERRCAELDASLADRAAQLHDVEERESANSLANAQRIDGMQRQLLEREEELARAVDVHQTLANERQHLQLRIDELDRRCTELDASLAERIAQLRDVEERESANSHANTQRIDGMQRQLREREEELARAAEAHQTLANEREHFQLRTTELERRCAELDAGLNHQKARVHDLESAAMQREELRVQLEREIRAQQERAERAEAQCGELAESGRGAEARNAEQSARIAELERTMEGRVIELQGHIDGCDRELARRAEALSTLRDDLARRAQRCDELEQLLHSQAQQATELAQRAEGEQRRFEGSLEALRGQLAEHENTLGQRAETEAHLRAELATRERMLTDLEGRCRDLETQLGERERAFGAIDGEYRALAQRSDSLEESLERRANELIEREQLVTSIREQVQALTVDMTRHREESEAFKTSLDEVASARLAALFRRRGEGAAETLPQAYLDGLAARDFGLAVRGLLGEPEPLSESALARLAERWNEQLEGWRNTPVDRQVVYLWADGCHVRAGLEREDSSVLLVVAGLIDGSKSVVALETGVRDSEEAWSRVLDGLRRRGIQSPRLIVADAALGLWPALANSGWNSTQQICWTRELETLVANFPERQQHRAEVLLRRMSTAPSIAAALKLKDLFTRRYGKRHETITERLESNWQRLTAYYEFPEEHWLHLRTTNVVETPLTTLRVRTTTAKAHERTPNAEAILWRLLQSVERGFRKLNAPQLVAAVAAEPPKPERAPRRRSRKTSA